MKQLLIFFVLGLLCLGIDLKRTDLSKASETPITVTVSGEVEEPRQLSLAPHTTIEEALKEVTLTEEADTSGLNPAMTLNDHDVLVIPSRKQEDERPRVSINTASSEELTVLPGIGPSTAEKIIDYRDEHGLFQTTEELMKVKGIGASRYEAIRDLITL